MRRLLRCAIVVLLPALAVSGAGAAAPVPRWDCAGGKGDRVLWRADLGTHAGLASVSDGVVLVSTNNERPRDPNVVGDYGVLMAFSADGGRFLWQVASPRLPRRTNDIPKERGASRPCIDNGRAYYTTNSGQLVCIASAAAPAATRPSAADPAGRVVWQLDMVKDLGIFKRDAGDVGNPLPAPLVVGDLVFCVTGNGVDKLDTAPPRPDAPSFLAVDKRSGQVVWTSSAPGRLIRYAQWSSPAYAKVDGIEEILFPGGDGRLYAFEPRSGKLLWDMLVSEPDRHIPSYAPVIVAPPVVDDAQGVVYVSLERDWETAHWRGHPLLAIDLRTRKVRWRFEDKDFNGTFVEAAVEGDEIYVLGSCSGLFELDRQTGGRKWDDSLEDSYGPARGAPVISNGKVYVAGDNSVYVFAAGPDRKLLGIYDLDELVEGSTVVAGGSLYVTTRDHLWALRPAGY